MLPITPDQNDSEIITVKQVMDVLNSSNHFTLELDIVTIEISKRLTYCDRGNWSWRVESKDIIEMWIDETDGFPRYYFNEEAMIMEINSWCKRRKVH